MSWATAYIHRLLQGETVKMRPRGGSMKGLIESGQLCTVEPIIDHALLKVGDVVLCEVKDRQYLHLIAGILREDHRFQIKNNCGHVNGWIWPEQIFGVCTKVEP